MKKNGGERKMDVDYIQHILFVQAVEQISDSVLFTDVNGIILYANPAFERHSGYSSDEVQGKTPRVLKSGKQDREFYETLWQSILAGKTWKGRLVNRKKTGELYFEETTIIPVNNKAGVITHFISVQQDVTRKQALQQQLQQAQKQEALGIGDIAHDFNNLLGTILGYAEIIKMELPENSQFDNDISEIISSARRAADLMKQHRLQGRLS